MKYCEEYGALLDAYVDGELSRLDTLRVAEHLKTCEGCRAYVTDALSIRAGFPGEEDEAVPEDFAAKVLAAVHDGKAPRETVPAGKKTVPWKKALLPLAACAALVVLVGRTGRKPASWDRTESIAATVAGDAAEAGAGSPALAEGQEAVPAGETAPESKAEEESDAADSARSNAAGAKNAYLYTSGGVNHDVMAAAQPAAEPEAAIVADVEPQPEHAISVTLTQSQGDAIAPLLADCALEEADGGTVVYLLRGDRFDDILAELERQNIPAAVTEAPADAPYRLYVKYSS